MDKRDFALVAVLLSLFLGMISFFDSGIVFFNEFVINVIFSIIVMIAVFAYANKRYFFNYMVLIYSSLSLMNLIYLYIYHPALLIVPNFVVCFVLFIKYSFFAERIKHKPAYSMDEGKDRVLADTVTEYSDLEPKISVDIISENPSEIDPKERKMLRRILDKIKKGIKVLKFPKRQSNFPLRSSPEESYLPESYKPDHSNPRDFDVTMDRTPKNGYFELKVDEKRYDDELPRHVKKSKPEVKTEGKIDKIFEDAITPLPEITYDSKKKKSISTKAKKPKKPKKN